MGIIAEKVKHAFTSDRRVAKQDRKSVKNLKGIIDDMNALNKKVETEDISRGDVQAAMRDIHQMIEDVKIGINEALQIEKDAEYQYYKLVKRIKEVEAGLEHSIVSKNPEKAKEFSQEMDKLVEEIHGIVQKERIQIREASHDREKILKYRHGIFGMWGLIRDMKKAEKRVRKEIGEEIKEENKLLHETDKAALEKEVKDFIEAAKDEVGDLYKIEHNDVVIVFDILTELHKIQELLQIILQKGFPEAQEHILEQELAATRSMLKEGLNSASHMDRQLKNMTLSP